MSEHRPITLIIVLAVLATLATAAVLTGACSLGGTEQATSLPSGTTTAAAGTEPAATAGTAGQAPAEPQPSAEPGGAPRLALPAAEGEPGLWLEKTTLAPKEQFQVTIVVPPSYPADAWVGVVVSNVPHGREAINDANDIYRQTVDRQISGTLTFIAPEAPGQYDLRLNDGDGQETASLTFTVTVPSGDVQPSLRLDKTTFAPGEEIRVYFTAPSAYATAWVGLLPSNVPHGDAATNDENDIDHQSLDGQTSGVLTFTAPEQPGSYDLRLNDGELDGKEILSLTFEVM